MKTIIDYAELVKENHALNKTIASVETDETDASKAYQVGEQLILSGILYDVIAAISVHDVITTTGSGANIAPAGPISAKIQTLTNQVQDHWTTGGKNKLVAILNEVDCNASQTVSVDLGTITLDEADTLILSFEQNITITSIERNTLYLHPSSGSDLYPTNTSTPSLNDGYHEGIIANVPAGTYTVRGWYQKPSSNVSYTHFMVRSSSITDPTYEPYTMTNKELTDNKAEKQTLSDEAETRAALGAHNLLNIDGGTKTGSATITVADGTITFNGTNSIYLIEFVSKITANVRYSICADGGSDSTYRAQIHNDTDDVWEGRAYNSDYHDYVLTKGKKYSIYLVISDTYTADNLVFKPIIILATDHDESFQPYAMTNRELTEKSIIKDVSGYSWDSAIDGTKDITVKRYGAIVSVYGYFRTTNALAQYANILSGLPHCASGAALSADIVHNMGMTLQNVDSATSKFVVNAATTANLQYAFNFVYLTDK